MPAAGSSAALAFHAEPVWRSDRFRLEPRPEVVSGARRRVTRRLELWGVPQEVRDAAVLVVSELVTNAVIHTGSGEVVCEVSLGAGSLRVEVLDDGGGWRGPRRQDAGPRRECGRGLALVEQLADAWGVLPRATGGRAVWAALHVPRD